MYTGLHVKHRSLDPILMKLEFSGQIFEKYSNLEFNENPPSGSRVVPYGQTDMTKRIVAFRNFANVPNNAVLVVQLPNYRQSLHITAAMSSLTTTYNTMQRTKRTVYQMGQECLHHVHNSLLDLQM
jgi:hypothetical protein